MLRFAAPQALAVFAFAPASPFPVSTSFTSATAAAAVAAAISSSASSIPLPTSSLLTATTSHSPRSPAAPAAASVSTSSARALALAAAPAQASLSTSPTAAGLVVAIPSVNPVDFVAVRVIQTDPAIRTRLGLDVGVVAALDPERAVVDIPAVGNTAPAQAALRQATVMGPADLVHLAQVGAREAKTAAGA